VTSHRRYYFSHEGKWPSSYEPLWEELQRQCTRNWWYNDPEVHGEALGVLEWRVTVSGEDQWRAHKRAIGLARTLYAVSRVPMDKIPTPIWETLPPHENRGYNRVL
jgi:hypothetical protein